MLLVIGQARNISLLPTSYYRSSKNLSLQLNLLNITDEDYVASLNNGGSRYYPGAPLSARLGVNFSF